MKNQFVDQPMRVYMMQPGDGTRYTFAIGRLRPRADQVIAGVTGAASDYYLLVILMPSGSGAAILSRWDLLQPNSGSVGYAQGHGLGSCHTYTVAACLLASSVLMNSPDDLDAATQAMLRVPEVLNG